MNFMGLFSGSSNRNHRPEIGLVQQPMSEGIEDKEKEEFVEPLETQVEDYGREVELVEETPFNEFGGYNLYRFTEDDRDELDEAGREIFEDRAEEVFARVKEIVGEQNRLLQNFLWRFIVSVNTHTGYGVEKLAKTPFEREIADNLLVAQRIGDEMDESLDLEGSLSRLKKYSDTRLGKGAFEVACHQAMIEVQYKNREPQLVGQEIGPTGDSVMNIMSKFARIGDDPQDVLSDTALSKNLRVFTSIPDDVFRINVTPALLGWMTTAKAKIERQMRTEVTYAQLTIDSDVCDRYAQLVGSEARISSNIGMQGPLEVEGAVGSKGQVYLYNRKDVRINNAKDSMALQMYFAQCTISTTPEYTALIGDINNLEKILEKEPGNDKAAAILNFYKRRAKDARADGSDLYVQRPVSVFTQIKKSDQFPYEAPKTVPYILKRGATFTDYSY